jgi:translocation and assembly module TamB
VRAKRRRAWIALAAAVVLIGLLAGGVGSVFWAAGTPGGTAWLLSALARLGTGITVVQPQGSLIGDFKAKQVVVAVHGTRVVVDTPEWRGLSITYTPYPATWAAIHATSLTASRTTITTTPSGKPFSLPKQIHLPVEIDVDNVRTDELLVPGLAPQVLRDVHAKVHLGAEHGTQHLFDDASARLEPLQITGLLHIGALAPMAMDLQLKAVQSSANSAAGPVLPPWAKNVRADWQAQLQAKGPLDRFNLQAMLRAQGQQLDATAQVAGNERWPLPQLQVKTQGLDLSALLLNAPLTSLTGNLSIAAATPTDKAATAELVARGDLANAKPGRWDQQHLPVKSLAFELRGRTDQRTRLDLSRFEARLADGNKDAGTLQGSGHWNADTFELLAQLTQLQPGSLDARLPAMSLSGPVNVSGQMPPKAADGTSAPPTFKASADLNGRLTDLAKAVQVKLAASGNPQHIELQEFKASSGGAQATLSGTADHASAAWRLKAKAGLVDFDPRPWFPGPSESAWQTGPHRFNLKSDADLTLPDATPNDKRTLLDRIATLRGEASAQVSDSVLAGTPLTADISLKHPQAADALQVAATAALADSRFKIDGEIAPDVHSNNDHWTVDAQAPTLARLGPVLRLLPAALPFTEGLAGTLQAHGEVHGRWPNLTTQGTAQAAAVKAGALAVGKGDLRWQLGSTADAPLELQADLTDAAWGVQQLSTAMLQLKGTVNSHALALRGELKAAPPAWMESIQARANTGNTPKTRTSFQADAQGALAGGFLDSSSATPGPLSWKGMLQRLEVRSGQSGDTPLLITKDVGIELESGAAPRVAVTAGRADILGAGLRWNRIEWQAGAGVQAQQLDMQAELEPIAVAPVLRRLQPNFGWGGDLMIGGRVVIHQATQFTADIVLERTKGDLTVTDETGTQAMGLTDLRLGLDAHDGVWSFTQGLAGAQLGVAAGALVVTTTPERAWPEPSAPVQGVLEAQVANLGTWGAWVPAGWRLNGQLRASASIGGHFSAIEYTGDMKGSDIGVRNLLQGVNITQGEVDISLRGDTAKINKLTARGGNGSVKLEGDAQLGETPRARVQLTADKFQLLGRVDRRIVTSGQAELLFDKEKLNADGKFMIDEGLIDFTRSNAPSLASDVVVTGRNKADEEPVPAPPSTRTTNVNLQVNLGDQLKLRGRGIDTRLRGELKLTTPGGKLALNGTVSAADGTYAAYGQKLTIDRGEVAFTGAIENPRVDIEATRPNLDVRVGVAITGPLLNLRVRLFSEPDLSNTDKLSWLMLGRASDGLGRSDTALLQRAALALLAGEGDGVTEQITKAIGLDEVSVSQNTTTADTRETVVSVGKQLSRRVYLSYEQNLNTSSGSVQLTYRIAQRFLARVQSGLDRSVDLIWTWRWE